MSVLRVSLFGGVRIVYDDQPSELKLPRMGQGLLAYLLLYRHRVHPREMLAGLFWGDRSEDRARGCLSTALWRLRCALEPEGVCRGTYLVTTPAGEVGFNQASNHWLDVAIFEERVGQVLARPFDALGKSDVHMIEHALQLYRGELLEGFYDDWALRERERMRLLYLNGLSYLMRYYKHHGVYNESLSYGHKILALDPLREEIHREMMRLYLEAGQRALAVQQYETCREILAAELGIPPMEETQALYAQIVPEAGNGQGQYTVVKEPASLQQALQQLRLAMHSFANAQEQLQHAIRLVERLAGD